jgi:hypothetical protein
MLCSGIIGGEEDEIIFNLTDTLTPECPDTSKMGCCLN